MADSTLVISSMAQAWAVLKKHCDTIRPFYKGTTDRRFYIFSEIFSLEAADRSDIRAIHGCINNILEGIDALSTLYSLYYDDGMRRVRLVDILHYISVHTPTTDAYSNILIGTLLIQFAKEHIEPLITSPHFRDEYEVWEELVDLFNDAHFAHTKNANNTPPNMIQRFAVVTQNLYLDSLPGLTQLFRNEDFTPNAENGHSGSGAFKTIFGGKEYDMTYAVRVVRTEFLRMRPAARQQLRGLEGEPLLLRIVALSQLGESWGTLKLKLAAYDADGRALGAELAGRMAALAVALQQSTIRKLHNKKDVDTWISRLTTNSCAAHKELSKISLERLGFHGEEYQ
jgi:hypothetical protein